MSLNYVLVRMPKKTYDLYRRIQTKMQNDLTNYSGKEIKLPMTKVLHAVASPQFNENFIEVDLKRLKEFSKKFRW